MKKDLFAALIFVAIAGLGIGGVFWWQIMQPEDDRITTIKPNPEKIAPLAKKEEPKKTLTEPVRVVINTPKKAPAEKDETPAKKIDDKTPVKVEPEPKEKAADPPPEKKIDVIEPKKQPTEVKAEPKKRPAAKVIAIGNDIKLNDADGEYVLKTINGGEKFTLQGKIKTLTLHGLNDKSTLDATLLEADEIVFTGNVNSGSTVLLGKARTLRIRDFNDRSTLDASVLNATEISLAGAVNGGSILKLHAPKGSVEIFGEINDQAQLDIAAPGGKVVFKGRGDSVINGNAKVTILAKEVEMRGAVNGAETRVNITFTKDGSLKFRRLSGGVHLHYSQASAGDPEPRIDSGEIDARAELRKLPALKR
jgi:hypothetical protein